jgi:hypothetical protein
MIWEAIAGGIKGLGDTILGFVKEYHMDPATAAELEQKVRTSLMDHERLMWDLERQERDSARKREIALNDPTTRRLAYIYTGGYFATFGALFFGWVDVREDMIRLVDVLMGVLTAGQYSVMTYYFGSSHSSASKDQVIDRVVNHKA